ncbi:MAG: zinc ribbon domain-containing protein [Oscillospiraceae bacterium]
MTTQDILLNIRKQYGLTQDEMAEKLFVTRQAISRWENGETIPNTDTLKIISSTFMIPINTLLGQPHNSICQVCGMPLNDNDFSKEADGTMNGKYCKWCYVNGEHKYSTMESVIEDILPNMNWGTPDERRIFLQQQLPELEYWKKQ